MCVCVCVCVCVYLYIFILNSRVYLGVFDSHFTRCIFNVAAIGLYKTRKHPGILENRVYNTCTILNELLYVRTTDTI